MDLATLQTPRKEISSVKEAPDLSELTRTTSFLLKLQRKHKSFNKTMKTWTLENLDLHGG